MKKNISIVVIIIIIILILFKIVFTINYYNPKINNNVKELYTSSSSIINRSFVELEYLIDNNKKISKIKLNNIYLDMYSCERIFNVIHEINPNININIENLVDYFGYLSKKENLTDKDISLIKKIINIKVYKSSQELYEKETLYFKPHISHLYQKKYKEIDIILK